MHRHTHVHHNTQPFQRLARTPTDLDHVLDSAVRVRLHDGFYPNQRLHLRLQAVGHQVKLAIWWNERDRTVVLEPGQPHALMKLDVLNLDRLRLARRWKLGHQEQTDTVHTDATST